MSGAIKYLLLIPFFLNISAFCQEINTDTSSKIVLFPKEHGEKKWKVLLGLDARRSFFAGVPVKLNGLKIGAEYKGVHRFGFGFYWLKKNLVFTEITVEEPNASMEPEVHFDLGYSSLFYERIFLKTRWWEVAFPVHLGGGRIRATYKDTLGAFNLLFEKPFSTLAISTQLKFYPLEWIAFRTSLGYRITFNTDKQVKQAFNRPFFGFGLSINILGCYQAIFKKPPTEKKNKEDNYEDAR